MSAQVSKFGNPEEVEGSASVSESMLITSVGPPTLQAGPDSDVQKLKDNLPRRHSASPQRRAARRSGGHENSAEHSPLHHNHQARVPNKVGVFSPSSERKISLEGGQGIAPNTPGRSRLRVSGRPDDSPEEGSAVPEFPVWNENDPSAGDSYTGIFEKVSEEKQTSATKVPMIIDDSVYLNRYHHDGGSDKSSIFCCFNWGKK